MPTTPQHKLPHSTSTNGTPPKHASSHQQAKTPPRRASHSITPVTSSPHDHSHHHHYFYQRSSSAKGAPTPSSPRKAESYPILIEGPLKKKGARVNMWSSRYAILRGPKLTLIRGHKKYDPHASKREFVLMPGSHVSEINEVPGKGRPMFEFRLHWPQHIANYGQGTAKGNPNLAKRSETIGSDSEGEEMMDSSSTTAAGNSSNTSTAPSATTINPTVEGGGVEDLAKLADQTAKQAKHHQKNRAAQIEKSEIEHQSLVSKGATLAGVVVGGVVIGALTAGVGLVPYLGLVGAAAAVGGGAVAYTAAHHSSSRIVLAAETEDEAMRWKGALEWQIAVLEGRRPPPPPEIDLQDVDRWIHNTSWRGVGVQEGLRVLEEEKAGGGMANKKMKDATLCRKTQVVIQATPIKVFLSIMATDGPSEAAVESLIEAVSTGAAAGGHSSHQSNLSSSQQQQQQQATTNHPSRRMAKRLTMVQQIDDHTDVIHIQLQPLPTTSNLLGGHLPQALHHLAPRDLCVMRYWRLDDDGTYIICLNSITQPQCPETPGVVRAMLHSVFSIAPRKDYADYEDDLTEALVTYIVQIDPKGCLSTSFSASSPSSSSKTSSSEASTEEEETTTKKAINKEEGTTEGSSTSSKGNSKEDSKKKEKNKSFSFSAGKREKLIKWAISPIAGRLRSSYADLILSQVLDVKEHLDLHRFRHREEGGGAGKGDSRDNQPENHVGGGNGGGEKGGQQHHSSSVTKSIKARFKRKKKKHYTFYHGNTFPTEGEGGAGASTKDPSQGRKGEMMDEHRQQITAASLRNMISAKEYEVHRLEMEIGRNGGAAMMVGAGAVMMTRGHQHIRDRSVDMLRQLQDQLAEVARLKAEYKTVTGKDWHQHQPPSTPPPRPVPHPSPSSATASPNHYTLARKGGGGEGGIPKGVTISVSPPPDNTLPPQNHGRRGSAAYSPSPSVTAGTITTGGGGLVGPGKEVSAPEAKGGEARRPGGGSLISPSPPTSSAIGSSSAAAAAAGGGPLNNRSNGISNMSEDGGGNGMMAMEGDTLRFDDAEGMPEHWVMTKRVSEEESLWEIGQKLVIILVFCGLFFTTMYIRRLFQLDEE